LLWHGLATMPRCRRPTPCGRRILFSVNKRGQEPMRRFFSLLGCLILGLSVTAPARGADPGPQSALLIVDGARRPTKPSSAAGSELEVGSPLLVALRGLERKRI